MTTKQTVRFIARVVFVIAMLTLVSWLAVTPWAYLLIIPAAAGILLVLILVVLGYRIELVPGKDFTDDQPHWLSKED